MECKRLCLVLSRNVALFCAPILAALLTGCSQRTTNSEFLSNSISLNTLEFSTQGGETLSLKGAGFKKNITKVFIDKYECPLKDSSTEDQLICTVPAIAGVALRTLLVKVGKTVKSYPKKLRFSVVVGRDSITDYGDPGMYGGLRAPGMVFIHSGKLFVADRSNNRILIYNSLPTTNYAKPDLVLGQKNFVSSSVSNSNKVSEATRDSFTSPASVVTDGTVLAVADTQNHRVLIWNSMPTINGQEADIVLGQPDFTSNTANTGGISASTLSTPVGLGISNGKLIVSDSGNNRVLIWNSFPTQNAQPADVVLGQADFTSGAANTSPNTPECDNVATRSRCSLSGPRSVHVGASGKFYVTDSKNNRVLIWDSLPTDNQAPADLVMGQGSFTSASNSGPNTALCGNVSGRNKCSLRDPNDVLEFGDQLYVADSGNKRVLVYDQLPSSNRPPASLVIGAPDFTTLNATDRNVDAKKIINPYGFTTDGTRLYISDNGSNRILGFLSLPTTDYPAADFVLGQKHMDYENYNYRDSSSKFLLTTPLQSLFVGNKFIATDRYSSRVLIWNSVPKTNTSLPDVVIGQPDIYSNKAHNGKNTAACGGVSGVNRCAVSEPWGVASDGTKLYIVDRINNRILGYNNIPTSNYAAADFVLGQPDFVSSADNNGASSAECGGVAGINACSLKDPTTIDISDNRLIVTDTGNNRILIWNTLPTSNKPADVVLGQSAFTTLTINNGPATPECGGVAGLNRCSLNTPTHAIIREGKLLVADKSNHRVLIWNNVPTTNGQPADLVLGQPDFFSNTANNGGISAKSLAHPYGLESVNGNLWVVEYGNNRMITYNKIPTTSYAKANKVLGQRSATAFDPPTLTSSYNTFSGPLWVSMGDGVFAISEQFANRIVIRPLDPQASEY